MIITSYVFGDIFSYQDDEYIFLANTSEQLFAAKILNKELTQKIISAYKRALKSGSLARERALVFCYVELKTEDFRGQIASLAKTENTNFDILSNKSSYSLCKEDLQALKKEVLESHGVPIKLQELMDSIEV